MESVVKVKKSLKTPIRTLTSCVSGVKEKKKLYVKHRNRRGRGRGGGGRGGRGRGGGGRGGGGRGGCNRWTETPPLRSALSKDTSVIRSYQADLEKERKLREAMNAQKNAERAAMRTHFRRKYQLSEDSKDSNHLRSVGGKVSLPRELSKIIRPETKTKDDGFNLLSAFQGLSFNSAVLTGRKHSTAPSPTPLNVDSCKVM